MREKKGEGEDKIKTDVMPAIQRLLPSPTLLEACQSYAATDFWSYPRLGMQDPGLLQEQRKERESFQRAGPEHHHLPFCSRQLEGALI